MSDFFAALGVALSIMCVGALFRAGWRLADVLFGPVRVDIGLPPKLENLSVNVVGPTTLKLRE